MTNDKLVVPQPEIEKATEPAAIALLRQYDPELGARAIAIMASRPGNAPITPDRAIAAALHEQKTGQVCGRDFYIDQYMGVVPGYRGIAREAKENGAGLWGDAYRPFNDEEKEEHEVKPGDQAYVCELTQYKAAEAARAAGVPYHPRLGFGIVKAAEHKSSKGIEIKLAGGFTWARKARNRALKDALRHAGLGDTAADILEDAGIEASEEVRQHATIEQATQQVRLAKFEADREARPEEVKAAEAAARAVHQRRASYDKAMGLAERCPDCGADLPDHADPCQWFEFAPRYGDIEDIPDQAEERDEAALTPAGHIRAGMMQAAAAFRGQATERDRRWANGSLGILVPDDALRSDLRLFLFGVEKAEELTDGEVVTLKNWISATKIPNPDAPDKPMWVPSEQAIADLRIILAEIVPQDQPQEAA